MTPEEIKKLCIEYVDELFAYDDMSEQENIEAKNDAFVMCMAFAGHILEKHCIVAKGDIKRYYNVDKCTIRDHRKRCGDKAQTRAAARIRLCESLFGKSLFNEGKE